MMPLIKFYVCSVGDPTKDYAKENLNRILTNSAFILHQDAKQKGVYEEIEPGSIVLLKFDRGLIAYGKSIANRITDEEGWNLWTDVKEWYFKNPDNIEEGVSLYGIAADTIAGGPYGTVKEVSTNFGWQKLQDINSTTSLHSEVKQLLSMTSPTNDISEMINLLKYKKQIILQGPPGTGKTYTAKEIAGQLISSDSSGRQILPDADDVKMLLSHGEHVPMRNSNKFIRVAELSDRSVKVSYREGKFFSLKFNRIADCIVSGNFTRKGGDAYLHALAEHTLKKWLKNNKRDEYVETSSSQIRLIQFHPAYSYEDFVRGITAKTSGSSVEYRTENRILAEFATLALENSSTQIEERQYVLIIDEINRANLPAVLGELIYALEYRDEPVESIYDLDGDRTLILPPNLYIIGTMNTADRSVGHIDYAIRRRFAFVDVLPSPVPVHAAAKNLFKQVSELFVSDYDLIDWQGPKPKRSQYVATDFRPEDIWIGHSYFMSDKQDDEGAKAELEIRLKYEILPLLKEYVKDGLLLPEAEEMIKKLHV
jgi:hypothetical protein